MHLSQPTIQMCALTCQNVRCVWWGWEVFKREVDAATGQFWCSFVMKVHLRLTGSGCQVAMGTH